MSVIVDTGILVGYLNPKDPLHGRAKNAMHSILSGRHGLPLGTDTVLDEGLTFLRKRHPVRAVAEEYASWFWGADDTPPRLKLALTDETLLREATDMHLHHHQSGLSFTDCTLMAHAARIGAPIATFDGQLKHLSNGLEF